MRITRPYTKRGRGGQPHAKRALFLAGAGNNALWLFESPLREGLGSVRCAPGAGPARSRNAIRERLARALRAIRVR